MKKKKKKEVKLLYVFLNIFINLSFYVDRDIIEILNWEDFSNHNII